MSGALLNNPSRLTGFLDATTRSITVDTGTTFGDLRRLASSLHGLNPKRVVFYTAPIADHDYSPPGYSGGGKVLLDAAKGAVLYGSIIDDTAKKSSTPTATAPTTTGTTTTGSTTTGTTSAPKPNANAGDKTCRL